uniref:Uncharacterized protein n=1 Tax=Arundo donax TaxID=35708 RepID=A0A0A9E954_ARUDO
MSSVDHIHPKDLHMRGWAPLLQLHLKPSDLTSLATSKPLLQLQLKPSERFVLFDEMRRVPARHRCDGAPQVPQVGYLLGCRF